ncbi:MAG: LegC family aminotransferase [Dechloromonas sp.]|nr:MAG: LegC family aminotransferase [Dechloromonas sp.]
MNPVLPDSSGERLVALLSDVLGAAGDGIPLHEPSFQGNELEYVKECLDTGWVSSVGKYVDEFERRLAAYTGVTHAIAAVNGTAALHVALLVAGVRAGDEVLLPALTFVATANAVSYCGAVPHFVDSCEQTLGVDPLALSAYLERIAERTPEGFRNRITGRRLAALVPMHTFGHPADMPALNGIAEKFGLAVIEDAAESLGSQIGSRHTGSFGAMGVLSFNGNKILTTGGGGAILTDDPVLAARLKHLTTTGKQQHKWEFFHTDVAYNYRMPNLNAAIGCAQLESLPGFLEKKRRLAAAYSSTFSGDGSFKFVVEPTGCSSNYWLNAIRVRGADRAQRDALLTAANEAGYWCRPAWTLMHRLPMYDDCPRAELPVAERLELELINLPSTPALAERLKG